jgi:uncharacterized membrane protein
MVDSRQALALRSARTSYQTINLGSTERLFSIVGGGILAGYGIQRRQSLLDCSLLAIGGGLLYRGLTGHCPVYGVLGVSSAEQHGPATSVAAGHGVKVEKAITILRSPEDLYRHWRQFDRLPEFMEHLQSVTCEGDRSHWVVQGPAGIPFEWDAEIIHDEENRLIAWRSLPGSQVDTAGSIHFQPAPGRRGTEIRVVLKYDPPTGKTGAVAAQLFGAAPGQQIERDLRRFKQLMEAGEVASVAGQSRCR